MSTSNAPPWFHGIEHLTMDGNGDVSWRGVVVEHYDHSVFAQPGWEDREKADATELGRRCRALEKRGIGVTELTACWVTGHWPKTLTSAELADLLRRFAPHGGNGLAEEIWSALRRAGENRLAEALTTITNEMRAAQYELAQQKREVQSTGEYVALYDEHGEIVYWDEREWIEDPSLVTTIARACLRAGKGEDLRGPLEGKDVHAAVPADDLTPTEV